MFTQKDAKCSTRQMSMETAFSIVKSLRTILKRFTFGKKSGGVPNASTRQNGTICTMRPSTRDVTITKVAPRKTSRKFSKLSSHFSPGWKAPTQCKQMKSPKVSKSLPTRQAQGKGYPIKCTRSRELIEGSSQNKYEQLKNNNN